MPPNTGLGGGRNLAGVGIHFLKDCSVKKRTIRKWEATGHQQLGLAGTWGLLSDDGKSVSEKQQGSGRATDNPRTHHRPSGDPGGDVSATVLHRLPRAGQSFLQRLELDAECEHVCPLPTSSFTGKANKLKPKPAVNSLICQSLCVWKDAKFPF